MKKIALNTDLPAPEAGLRNLLVHESPYFKSMAFALAPGGELPVHNHDIEGQLALTVIQGNGAFVGADGELAAGPGDVLVADIAEPHGIRAETAMLVVAFIAPPI